MRGDEGEGRGEGGEGRRGGHQIRYHSREAISRDYLQGHEAGQEGGLILVRVVGMDRLPWRAGRRDERRKLIQDRILTEGRAKDRVEGATAAAAAAAATAAAAAAARALKVVRRGGSEQELSQRALHSGRALEREQ